jgi:hypothetical protein
VKVFVDEDTGAGLGRALRAVAVEAEYVSKSRRIQPGTPDEIWIPWAGKNGFLVLSRNTGILAAEAQRALVIAHEVGIVFLPQYLSAFDLLRLVLKKWDWLETADASESRPFAFQLSPGGRSRRLQLRPPSSHALRQASDTANPLREQP